MSRRVLPAALLLALAWTTGGPAVAAAPPATSPISVRALLTRLRAAGRAEAVVRLRQVDPLSGRTIERRARLALEMPRFARLDFDDGEKLTLRPDGGDWLQPALRQLVRAGPRGAAGAMQWWGALLDPAGAGVEERRTAERAFTLRLRGPGAGPAAAGPGSPAAPASVLRLELDAQGLPRRLALGPAGSGSLEYRTSRWRFARARGAGSFTLAAPAGCEVVTLP